MAYNPPIGSIKWYILPIGGLYATYHLLGEPETTIEIPYPKTPFSEKKQPIACVCPSNALAGSAKTSCHDSGSAKKQQQLSQFGTPIHPEKLEPESMPGSSRCDLFGCFE